MSKECIHFFGPLCIYYISAVVTQHIKSVACHNWLHSATYFSIAKAHIDLDKSATTLWRRNYFF